LGIVIVMPESLVRSVREGQGGGDDFYLIAVKR
jgi:hypothetical protein